MSMFAEMQVAATEAQSVIAQLQGVALNGFNFVGPDGRSYLMVFRTADAFESQQLAHGYQDRSTVMATATRAQFSAPPLDWRRKKGTRTIPAPPKDAIIASVDDSDALHYTFTLLVKQ
jgi:hypothetical protein